MTSGQAVIYIQRNGFYYKESAENAVAFHFSFLPSVVSDLDVIDNKTLSSSIVSFIQQNNLQAKDCIIVVSESVYFEKDYAGITKEQEQPVTQLFVDSIPFENVLVKTYLIENGIKIVAANRELCAAIKNAFETSAFTVSSITPTVALGTRETNAIDDTFKSFFEKYEFLKEDSFPLFVTQRAKKSSQTDGKNITTQKKSNMRTIFLIVVFFILIFILVIMLLSGSTP